MGGAEWISGDAEETAGDAECMLALTVLFQAETEHCAPCAGG